MTLFSSNRFMRKTLKCVSRIITLMSREVKETAQLSPNLTEEGFISMKLSGKELLKYHQKHEDPEINEYIELELSNVLGG